MAKIGDIKVHATRTDYTITVDGETVSVRSRDAAALGVSLAKWGTNPHSVKGVGAEALRSIAAELLSEANRRDAVEADDFEADGIAAARHAMMTARAERDDARARLDALTRSVTKVAEALESRRRPDSLSAACACDLRRAVAEVES